MLEHINQMKEAAGQGAELAHQEAITVLITQEGQGKGDGAEKATREDDGGRG